MVPFFCLRCIRRVKEIQPSDRFKDSGCSSAGSEHLAWDQGAAGSNPVTLTKMWGGKRDGLQV